MDQINIELLMDKLKNTVIEANGQFPNEFTTNDKYKFGENRSWTEGFWIGLLWNAYELTNDSFFYATALSYTDKMCERINNKYRVDHHDLGFLIGLSVVPAYQYTNNIEFLKVIKSAADILVSRYNSQGEYIQAWGEFGDPHENRFIVDSLLNIPFLFQASQILNEKKYSKVAKSHYDTVLKYGIRSDYTSHHTVFIDPQSGEFLYGETNQGHSDTSCWSRGQSWIIAGMAFNKKYGMKFDQQLFENLCTVVDNNIPSNNILYWDFDFNDQNQSYLDAASNAIILCGLTDLGIEDEAIVQRLEKGAIDSINYDIKSHQLLNNCTYNVPQNKGINSGNIWGDYFLSEYLTRKLKPSFKGRF